MDSSACTPMPFRISYHMKTCSLVLILASIAASPKFSTAWSSPMARTQGGKTNSELNEISPSRREMLTTSIMQTAALTVFSTFPQPVLAGGGAGENEPRLTNRMGGLLEPYQDTARGIRMMSPVGWNKFEGEVGAYDVKWQDLVDPTENIKISSTPVKSTTESIAALGPVKEVGERLASKRDAKLMAASERLTENVLFYTFDFAINDGTHQLLLLCVCKGKLWSLDASAKERRWDKREDLYKNVLGSFVPKLNA